MVYYMSTKTSTDNVIRTKSNFTDRKLWRQWKTPYSLVFFLAALFHGETRGMMMKRGACRRR